MLCKIFLPFSRSPFSFNDDFFHYAKYFQFDVIPFVYFCFCFSCLWNPIHKKISLRLMFRRLPLMFSSGILWFQILHSGFYSIFQLIFVHRIREWSCGCLFFPGPFVEENVLSPLYDLGFLVIN